MRIILPVILSSLVYGATKVVDDCYKLCNYLDCLKKSTCQPNGLCSNIFINFKDGLEYGQHSDDGTIICSDVKSTISDYFRREKSKGDFLGWWYQGSIGMKNLGNTCYLNSMLQVISHTLPILQSVGNIGQYTEQINNAKKLLKDKEEYNNLILFESYLEFLKLLWKKPSHNYFVQSSDIIEPRSILTALHYAQKDRHAFVVNKQEDVDEAMRIFFDGISSGARIIEEKVFGKDETNVLANLFSFNESSWMQCKVCKKKRNGAGSIQNALYLDVPVSKHPIPLGGWKEMQEVYGVLNEGLKRDILKDAVAEYEEVYTLEQLFADRNKVGEIADVNCEECRAKRDHIHATQIRGMGPRILVIVLKRFSYDGSKIKSRVEYPIAFDLANMSPGATGTYLLSGVVFHHGTGRNRGHYTSEFYNSYKTVGPDGEKSDRWFSADDQIVTELPNGPKLVSGEAYVLVYTRM